MKIYQRIFLLVSIIGSLDSLAHTGVGSSGGGNAVVCRNGNFEIESATLLDVYEAEVRGSISLEPLDNTTSEYRRMLSRIRKVILDERDPTVEDEERFEQNLNSFTMVNHPLDPVGDIGLTVPLPDNCKIEQLAIYMDDHSILVSEEIWNHLDILNRVALYAHEIIYREYRYGLGVSTSEGVRKVVGRLFSENLPLPAQNADLPEGAKLCFGGDFDEGTQFHFYVDRANQQIVLRFNKVWGLQTYHPVEAKFQIGSTETVDIMDGPLQGYAFNLTMGQTYPLTVKIFPTGGRQFREMKVDGCQVPKPLL